ncbi:hypothetical protein K458DRAFT_417145 [Lentithecium fluviatile CBS 122367]|uniref:Uncharacterized protein n=1 Tax=Lentithecium fluviatile CBS 122367 TaxID=1168545 RepID=A0A6G1J3F4_9PLEO|nr:hypothetical protein K458DRAFT_417145 [Lentithecium fluviatile CBS 122367]
MAAVARRRSSAAANPLSPSIIPDLQILPQPLAENALPVGQLASKTSKLDPSTLEDRDYDDIGVRWYKDVILFDSATGRFVDSLGSAWSIKKPADGTEAGTIEAPETRVRLLKDADAAFKKVLQSDEAKQWIKDNKDAGFVVGTRQVTNASYKRARLVDVGNGDYEVQREVGGEGQGGKRRGSELPVQTNSKTDVVGVLVRGIVVAGGEPALGEEVKVEYWD